uniref:Dual specificity phosphatase 13A n=1 Tax=Pseudonaja textilis TaxID=8673 RepID=A0A670ZT43_PSETE
MADESASVGPKDLGPPSEDSPSVQDLEQLLNTGSPSCHHADEVWPNLFLGDHESGFPIDLAYPATLGHSNGRKYEPIAKLLNFDAAMVVTTEKGHKSLFSVPRRFDLWKMGISHVLNAAHGTLFCQESHEFYGTTIEYHGVPAHDLPNFDLSLYFYSSAEFIHKALTTPGGKIFVHCAFGISRSSSLVLAYLMIYHHFSLVKAIQTVKEHRWIFPNRGFLKQLQKLDLQLRNKMNK